MFTSDIPSRWVLWISSEGIILTPFLSASSQPTNSPYRVTLLNRVVLGNQYRITSSGTYLKKPPGDYDSMLDKQFGVSYSEIRDLLNEPILTNAIAKELFIC